MGVRGGRGMVGVRGRDGRGPGGDWGGGLGVVGFEVIGWGF